MNQTRTDKSAIRIRGARENNLNNLDVDIPLNALTVVCGPSGAGKTSLVIGTLFAESQRRFIETIGTRRRGKFSLWKRSDVDSIENLPPATTVTDKVDPNQTLAQLCGVDDALALAFSQRAKLVCPDCSENVPSGGVDSVADYFERNYPGCRAQIAFSPVTENNEYDSFSMLAMDYSQRGFTRWLCLKREVRGEKRDEEFELQVASCELREVLEKKRETRGAKRETENEQQEFYLLADRLVFRSGDSRTRESFELAFTESGGKAVVFIETPNGTLKRFAGQGRACPKCGRQFPDCYVERFYLSELPPEKTVERENVLAYQLFGKNLLEWSSMSADKILTTISSDEYLNSRFEPVLTALQNVGLGYMALSRKVETMSPGQIRRASIAAMIASQLVNMLYVFDEPTEGLAPQNRPALLTALQSLRNRGNTVVIAENDKSFIEAADYVVDLGTRIDRPTPKSEQPQPILQTIKTVEPSDPIEIQPGTITAIVGPAGAGKTTRLLQLAGKKTPWCTQQYYNSGLQTFEDIILVEHKIERKSPKGCIATYMKIWDTIRDELATTPEAAVHGFTPGDFSLLGGNGRCPQCKGEGTVTINLEYLPEIEMVCDECQGERFRKEYLQPRFRGLNAFEILRLTVRDAFVFFRNIRKVQIALKLLLDMGLEYIELGQPIKTLSTGERNRIDLAIAVGTLHKQKTLFLLDEPSSGLHDSELVFLMETLNRVTAYSHAVVMIENRIG